MNIPPYWAKERFTGPNRRGTEETFTASGWSFHSMEEARGEALSRAKRIFDLITMGKKPQEYEYLDRPIREEIVEVVDKDQSNTSEPGLVITRNRYGALVLNASQVLFADVDCPRARPTGLWEALLWPFSSARRKRKQEALWEETVSRVEDWGRANGRRRFRLYRTHSGLRLFFVDKLYDPTSQEVTRLLSDLGSDPLYKKLTEKQQCFRARLTPKPWRCAKERPPNSYPWTDADEEEAYRRWEADYTRASEGYMTCLLMEKDAPLSGIPVIQRAISIHDQWCCREPELPLA